MYWIKTNKYNPPDPETPDYKSIMNDVAKRWTTGYQTDGLIETEEFIPNMKNISLIYHTELSLRKRKSASQFEDFIEQKFNLKKKDRKFLIIQPTYDDDNKSLAHKFSYTDGFNEEDINKRVSDKFFYDGSETAELMKNPRPFQKEIIDLVTKTIPDDRQIIWIVDKEGKKGKTKLIKHLCYHHAEDISCILIGTSSQLRNALIGIGERRTYILDLPRTRGINDSMVDLISVIESLKNGHIT